MKNIISILTIFLTISYFGFGEVPLRLAMPDYPPYTYMLQNEYAGLGYELFKRVMESTDIPYLIYPVPNYGRAFQDTLLEKTDGFFLASQNPQRDVIARFSIPITKSIWTWVTYVHSDLDPMNSDSFRKKARVGVQLNSNLHTWLLKEGFRVTGAPTNIESLFKLLELNRVNAILLPKAAAMRIIKNSGLDINDFHMETESIKPLGIYISKEYLAEYPDTLKKINKAIRKLNLP